MISPTNINYIDQYNHQSTMKPTNFNLNNMNPSNNYFGMKPQLNQFSISPASDPNIAAQIY
jgi:hypothetical protein